MAPSLGSGSQLLEVIRAERLIPLSRLWLCVLQKERPVSTASLEDAFWGALGLFWRRVAAHNIHMIDGWRKVRSTLEAVGVSPIPIKGPALSALAYGDGALRQLDDLDAVVPVEELPRAAEALLRAGYSLASGPPPERRIEYARSLQEWVFQDPYGRVLEVKPVPISHGIGRPEDVALLRARLKDVTLDSGGTVWRAPDRIAMTIVACMHGVSDGWPDVRHVSDVAGLLARFTDADWRELPRVAGEWRQARTVAYGIALCRRLDMLGAAGSEGGPVLPRAARAYLDRDVERLSADSIERLSAFSSWRHAIRLREHRRDAWRCLWRVPMVPNALDWALVPEAWPGWTVAFVRPLRLWKKRREFVS